MVKLQAFVGDGGSPGGTFSVFGSLVSIPERWAGFAEEWQSVCDREPRTPGFAMSKAANLEEYNWTAAQRDQRLQELLDVIHKRAMYRLDAVTKRGSYESTVQGKVPPEIDDIQFVLLFNLILGACKLMDLEGLDGTVEFIFDKNGAIGEADSLRWYQWIKDNPLVGPEIKKRLGAAPVFAESDRVLPLRAADLYAWQVSNFYNQDLPNRRRPNAWLNFLGKIYGVSSYVEQKDVATLVYSIQRGLPLGAHCGPAAGFLGFSPDPIQA